MKSAQRRTAVCLTLYMLVCAFLSQAVLPRSLEMRLGSIDASANPLLQLEAHYGSGVWRDPRVHNYRDPLEKAVLLATRSGVELRYADANDLAVFRGYNKNDAVIASLLTWRTARQIGLSSTEATVVKAYGKPQVVTKVGPSTKLLMYRNGEWELRFTVLDSRVKGILIQRFPPYPSHY